MSAETLTTPPDAAASHRHAEPERTADAVAEPARRVTCYSIRAAADPGLMSRVLELFAKRGMVPDRWHSDLVGPAREELSIDLQVEGLSRHDGDYIARCLRQIWGVEAVLTSEKRFA